MVLTAAMMPCVHVVRAASHLARDSNQKNDKTAIKMKDFRTLNFTSPQTLFEHNKSRRPTTASSKAHQKTKFYRRSDEHRTLHGRKEKNDFPLSCGGEILKYKLYVRGSYACNDELECVTFFSFFFCDIAVCRVCPHSIFAGRSWEMSKSNLKVFQVKYNNQQSTVSVFGLLTTACLLNIHL